MDHGYYQDRISAYFDGELSDYDERVVREHLQGCDECRKRLEELKQIEQLVAEQSPLGDDAYWEASARRIESALAAEDEIGEPVPAKPGWKGLGWKLAAVAASVAALTFIGLHQTDILTTDVVPTPEQVGEAPEDMAIPPPISWGEHRAADTAGESKWEESEAVPPAAAPSPEAAGRVSADSSGDRLDDKRGTLSDKDVEFEGRVARDTASSGRVEGAPADAPTRAAPTTDSVPVIEPDTVTVYRTKKHELSFAEAEEELPELLEEKIPVPPQALSERVAEDTVGMVELFDHLQNIARASGDEPVGGAAAGRMKSYTGKGIGTDSAVTTADLETWVKRRDSLVARWQVLKKLDKDLAIESTALRESQLSDLDFVEQQLLAAHYTIARLAEGTDDSLYQETVAALQDYMSQPDSRHLSQARDYLQRLGEGLR